MRDGEDRELYLLREELDRIQQRQRDMLARIEHLKRRRVGLRVVRSLDRFV